MAPAPVAEGWASSAWWTVLVAYVVGATPFGFLAGKLKGIDIRQHGSGNIGATNVLRTLGKPTGIAVLALDALKGLLPVLLARWAVGPQSEVEGSSLVTIAAAVAAILGHNYTFWLGFKGGKGIATSAGALAPVLPLPFVVALAVWLLGFAISRYVSVASLLAAISLPVAAACQMTMNGAWNRPVLAFSIFLATMAIWRHRSNIRRLINGEENRFVPGKRKPDPPTKKP